MMMRRVVFGFLLALSLGALGCGDVSGESGGSAGSGGVGGTGGVMMFEPGPTCIAFCANVVGECDALAEVQGFEDVDEESCVQGCESNLADEGAKSEACGDAVEAVFECAAELDCQGVDDWLQQPSPAYPCLSEVASVDTVCPQN
jgi:hypothetical protein